MRTSIFSPNTLQIELAINREKFRSTEDKLRIAEEKLEQLYQALERMRVDRDEWRLQFEGAVRDLKHTQDLLEHIKQTHANKSKAAYWLAGATSCISFIASVLSNIGTSLLFSTPPNPSLAYMTLGISGALSLIATIVMVIMAKGG
jgi:hypothetical protein